jgi:hypothetical protein
MRVGGEAAAERRAAAAEPAAQLFRLAHRVLQALVGGHEGNATAIGATLDTLQEQVAACLAVPGGGGGAASAVRQLPARTLLGALEGNAALRVEAAPAALLEFLGRRAPRSTAGSPQTRKGGNAEAQARSARGKRWEGFRGGVRGGEPWSTLAGVCNAGRGGWGWRIRGADHVAWRSRRRVAVTRAPGSTVTAVERLGIFRLGPGTHRRA